MRTPMRLTVFGAILTALLLSMLVIRPDATETTVKASSHAEAPLIALDRPADNTDLYAFRSPDNPNSVTFIANYIPMQEPASGPNFESNFDDNVLYQLRFDNNGDARVDLVLEFRFTTTVSNPDTFLYNTNQVTSLDDPDLVVKQRYSVTARVRQGDPTTPTFSSFVLGSNIPVAPANVGTRSMPNYESQLATPAITNMPTGAGNIRVFAGPRDDAFSLDLGAVFDLLGLRPFNSAHLIPLPNEAGRNTLANFNVNSIAIQIPISLITSTASQPSQPTDPAAIVGVYATAARPSMRVLNTNGTATTTGDCSQGQGIPGAPATCVQVSRIGNPLVNELFIPRGSSTTVSENDKDLFNAQLPATDINRIDYIRGTAARGVEPVVLINLLYPPVNDAPTSGRIDLVRVFLTGVPGATRPAVQMDPNDPSAGPGAVPSELMRLNVAVPVTAAGSRNRLGVIGGDLGGYPNGRRPGDDVVDITLRVGAGVLLPGNACAGGTVSCNTAPNNQLSDGVDSNERPLPETFPFLASPTSGYDTLHFDTRGTSGGGQAN